MGENALINHYNHTKNATIVEHATHMSLTSIERLSDVHIPERLMEIPEPPKELFVRGRLPPHDTKHLAIVGSRRYTPYGRDVCETLVRGLAGFPIIIVSGLALGIDAIAHRAALDARLTTIALPGSGISDDVLYPASNRELARRILEAGGALLSEFPPDFRAAPWAFPARNRLMAGLCHAVLIIEAEQKSGTLITARLATEYNRDVMTVPGPVFSKTSEGPHLLLKLGATPVRTSHDILEALGWSSESKPNQAVLIEELSPEEKKVFSALDTPQIRDELIRALDMPTYKANILLSAMELKGLITESMGEVRRKE